MAKIVNAPEQDVVVSSRVRLARNYVDLPFMSKIDDAGAREVVRRAREAIDRGDDARAYALYRLDELPECERLRLVERRLISSDLLKNPARGAALISRGETVSIMLNEEDHLRIQGLLPGMQIERAAALAFAADDQLNARDEYAFDARWGYLTGCPTNTGTGMRASAMLHLPALAELGQISALLQSLSKLGLTLRGFYGEGSEARGSLFQLSNQVTLGRTEEDMLGTLAAAAQQIVQHERAMREAIRKHDELLLADRVMRAMGALRTARLLGTGEMMQLYALTRMGAAMELLPLSPRLLDALIVDAQDASLEAVVGHALGERERDAARATLVRQTLEKALRADNENA